MLEEEREPVQQQGEAIEGLEVVSATDQIIESYRRISEEAKDKHIQKVETASGT